MSQMKCKCGEILNLTDPVIEVVNQVSFSMLVVNHGVMQGKTCPKCGQVFIMVIAGFDLAALKITMMEMPKQEPENLITTDIPKNFDPTKMRMN